MRWQLLAAVAAAALVGPLAAPAFAEDASAEMYAVSKDGVGDEIGTVELSDSEEGLKLAVDVQGLSPGPHGFHLHESGSCDPAANAEGQMTAAGAAGGHYDPEGTKQHLGPEGAGHKGDLPVLEVGSDGMGMGELTAPHLTVADARGKALMIHAGGDNYSDQPKPLGGGGGRVACGVVE
ncbi:MAG: superoxide dismutase [Cu-Zn] SodC [Geminicoccaceae bacterium]